MPPAVPRKALRDDAAGMSGAGCLQLPLLMLGAGLYPRCPSCTCNLHPLTQGQPAARGQHLLQRRCARHAVPDHARCRPCRCPSASRWRSCTTAASSGARQGHIHKGWGPGCPRPALAGMPPMPGCKRNSDCTPGQVADWLVGPPLPAARPAARPLVLHRQRQRALPLPCRRPGPRPCSRAAPAESASPHPLRTLCPPQVTRNIVDAASSKAMPVEETLEISVKPGWKEGTRITFAGGFFVG